MRSRLSAVPLLAFVVIVTLLPLMPIVCEGGSFGGRLAESLESGISPSRFEDGNGLAPEETGVFAGGLRHGLVYSSLGRGNAKRKAGLSVVLGIESTCDNSTSLAGTLAPRASRPWQRVWHTRSGILDILPLIDYDYDNDNDNRIHSLENLANTNVSSGPPDQRGSLLAILVSLVVGIIWF